MNERRQKKKEDTPLFSEKSERILVGEALLDPAVFWELHGRIKRQHFSVPRLARVWDAMIRATEKGRPPTRTWVPGFMQGDSQEEHPAVFYLNLLVNDAQQEDHRDWRLHADTVLGLASKRAIIDSLESARQKIMVSDFGTAPEDLQDIAMRSIGNALEDDIDAEMRSYEDWGVQLWREVSENLDRGEDDTAGIGLSSGLRAVDEVWGNLMPDKLYILAGLSGAGKSALAQQIAEGAGAAAKKRKMGPGYISSQEMTGKDYAARALAREMGVTSDVLERGAIDRSQAERLFDRAKNLSKSGLIIDAKAGLTIAEVRARMLKIKMKYGGISFAFIDHLIIMGAEKGETLFDKISSATIGAKNLAKEFHIPVILLAQIDEKKLMESASKWPNTTHLFAGANVIKQNADAIGFIHRHVEVLRKLEPPKGNPEDPNDKKAQAHANWVKRMDEQRTKAHFFNDKRRGGAGGVSRELRWYGDTTHFEDV